MTQAPPPSPAAATQAPGAPGTARQPDLDPYAHPDTDPGTPDGASAPNTPDTPDTPDAPAGGTEAEHPAARTAPRPAGSRALRARTGSRTALPQTPSQPPRSPRSPQPPTALRQLRQLRRAAADRLTGERGRALGFAAIGLSGFVPNLLLIWLLTAGAALHEAPAAVLANQAGVLWNFLLTDRLLYGASHAAQRRPWIVRLLSYAGLSNTDLLLRVPLTTWLVSGLGGNAVAVTAVLLLFFAAARFLVVDRLLYRAKKRSINHEPYPSSRPPH